MLFLVRSSGTQVYKQELGLKDIDLRVIGVLGRMGPSTSTGLVGLVGSGKPQISRATSELIGQGLLKHDHHRAPFELTPEGRRIFDKMYAISQQRQELVLRSLSDDDRTFLAQCLTQMTRLGEEWLAEERRLAAGVRTSDDSLLFGASGDIASDDELIPSLVKMSILMQRASYLEFRRTVGILPFNWVVLSRVAEAGRLRLLSLVWLTARDKSQIWRTVSRLVEEGLLLRHPVPGSREVELSVTEEGARIYEITAQQSLERNAMVTAALGRRNRDRFRRLTEVMISNAQRLMRRNDAGP